MESYRERILHAASVEAERTIRKHGMYAPNEVLAILAKEAFKAVTEEEVTGASGEFYLAFPEYVGMV